MVTSDYHAQYLDKVAFNKMLSYAKEYQPDVFVINGDLVDYFQASTFEKDPCRKTTIYQEVLIAINILRKIRAAVKNDCKIYWIEGNHELRLSRYLRTHNDVLNFPFFNTEKLFRLNEFNVKLIKASADYDKEPSNLGYLKISDMTIMHGDNRLNGASTSKYSGYSASNTVRGLMCNVLIGHSHRAAKIFHTTPYKTYVGLEGGCLCRKMGSANWVQAFITFEHDDERSFNHRVIRTDDL